MSRRGLFVAMLVLGIGSAGSVLAVDQASTNFQNRGSTFAPTLFDVASNNFSVNAAVEDIVGAVAGNNFQTMDGVPLKEPPPGAPAPSPTPPAAGGGTGTPDYLNPPTLKYRPYTFKSSQKIYGTHDAATAQVWINGSSAGVTYPSNLSWERTLPLFLGPNMIAAQGFGFNGLRSAYVGGQIERVLVGDVSRNHRVDDVDLSKFTRAWKKFNFFADFNEDEKIDDLDLSLLASHWGMSF